MKISQAAKIWIDYHVTNSKKNTVRAYRWIINKFCVDFGEEEYIVCFSRIWWWVFCRCIPTNCRK